MLRTIITINEEDKEWLDHFSHANHQSMAQTIRRAIQHFRQQNKKGQNKNILEKTAGLWKKNKKTGLRYVEESRREWNKTK